MALRRNADYEKLWNRLKDDDWNGGLDILRKNPALLTARGANYATPIQEAVSRGRTEAVVELLKMDGSKIGDALLHAVKKGDLAIVNLIMDNMKQRGLPTDIAFDGMHFRNYTTPLVLACLEENYDLVAFFLKQGHLLTLPHGYKCKCASCTEDHPRGESLDTKMRRLEFYAAACSQAFVLHQEDPFDYAITFSRYLQKCKNYDATFEAKYNVLIDKLDDIAISFISTCDKQESAELILSGPLKEATNSECVFGLARVDEAIESSRKEFVAQPNCQWIMQTVFRGDWNDAFHCSRTKRVGRFLLHTLLYPISALLYVFSCNKFPPSFKNPAARALTSFSSYVTFLAMIIFYMQYKEPRAQLGRQSLGTKDVALGYLVLYVGGMWLVFITDLRRLGLSALFSMWWRIYDLFFMIIWTCTLYAFADAVLQANAHKLHNLHRVHWSPDEPQLIFEIFFTWAAIMSSVRLFYYGQLLDQFGLITISILRCVPTILRFVVVLFVVLASFAVGVNFLYEHYKDSAVVRDGITIVQTFKLTSIFSAARYLYWAYYGYLPPETWEVVVGEIGNGTKREEKSHWIISKAGEYMGGVYHVIELIILLKLLVAIMSAMAVEIVEKESVDWKFIRAAIWAEYFQDSRAVPPPFNLLQLVFHGSIYLVRKCSGRKDAISFWVRIFSMCIELQRKKNQIHTRKSSQPRRNVSWCQKPSVLEAFGGKTEPKVLVKEEKAAFTAHISARAVV